jgi:hypothetical protein
MTLVSIAPLGLQLEDCVNDSISVFRFICVAFKEKS